MVWRKTSLKLKTNYKNIAMKDHNNPPTKDMSGQKDDDQKLSDDLDQLSRNVDKSNENLKAELEAFDKEIDKSSDEIDKHLSKLDEVEKEASDKLDELIVAEVQDVTNEDKDQ